MQLTQEQIQDLYSFTRKHYVEHYDVQTELVDHLANDIEGICIENPNLTFEQARDKSFKKFGVFGFMNVVEEKQKQLNKKYIKILWSFTKEWLELPKIIISATLFVFFYWFLQLNFADTVLTTLIIIAFSFALYKMFHFRNQINKSDKKWLLKDVLLVQGSANTMFIISYLLHTTGVNYGNGNLKTILYSILYTMVCVISYVSFSVIPKKSEELLEKEYPEYKLAQ